MRLSRMPAGSGRYPSGQRGQTVNLLAYAFGGSNPPLPTMLSAVAAPERSVGVPKLTGVTPRREAASQAARQWRVRGNSSAVERQPSKLGVAGSNPVSRSSELREASRISPGASRTTAHVAQLVEHALGKGEVSGSIPDMGSIRTGDSSRNDLERNRERTPVNQERR